MAMMGRFDYFTWRIYSPAYLLSLNNLELAEEFRNSKHWDEDLCRDLCWRANLFGEYHTSNEDTRKSIIHFAAEKLGINIGEDKPVAPIATVTVHSCCFPEKENKEESKPKKQPRVYTKNLIKTVVDKSVADKWSSAVLEWDIFDMTEDTSANSQCICGKENIRYLYTIRNKKNKNLLVPIGSSCIRKFERDDLNDEVEVQEKLFKLFHAFENKEKIEFNTKYFSRKLLRYLYEHSVFQPSRYNQWKAVNDYDFMVDMFNKRSRTESQEKKVTAIIMNYIKPYLYKEVQKRVKYNS